MTCLCARHDELARGLRALRQGEHVLLTGGAGVGKTRLAREIVDVLGAVRHGPVWLSATRAGSRIPFGVFAPCLDGLTDDTSPLRLLSWIGARLRTRAGDRRLLLVVDDADLLDDFSAILVRQLVDRRDADLVMTTRHGEQVPEALLPIRFDRIALAPFDLAGVTELTAAILGGPVDVLTAARIQHWTGGNALFVHELLRAGAADGRLRRGDVWQWTGPCVLTSGLVDLVGARVRDLTGAAHRAVTLVAVGGPVPVDVLCGLVGAPAVDTLVRRGLLAEDAGTVRLPHPLYADAHVAHLSTVVANRARTDLADALAGSPAEVLRVVTLRLAAQVRPTDDELLTAAERALRLSDAALGAKLAGAANRSPRQVMALARARIQQGRALDAERMLATLPTTALRVTNLVLALGRISLALRLLDDLGETVESAALRVMALTFRGEHRAAVRVFDSRFAGTSPQRVPAAAAGSAAAALTHLGRYDEALTVTRSALRFVTDDDPVDRLALRAGEASALLLAGRFTEARTAADALCDWGVRDRWAGPTMYGRTVIGLVAAAHGRYGQAIGLLRDAVVAATEFDAFDSLDWPRAALAMCHAATGDLPSARNTVAQVRRLAEPTHEGRLNIEFNEWVHAYVLASAGHVLEACDVLTALTAHCVATGAADHGVASAHLLARIGRAPAAARSVARLCPSAVVAKAHVAHVEALAARDPEALVEVSGCYAALGCPHLAAESADAAASLLSGRAAAAAVRRRDTLLSRCDTGPLPWWPSAGRHALTTRERQVAVLAARGVRNRDIATQLTLSVRTVENHLQRVYDKLGVDGRADLGDALEVE